VGEVARRHGGEEVLKPAIGVDVEVARHVCPPSVELAIWKPRNAPEWTRTITGKSPHKALNLVGARPMRPLASTASDLRAFASPSDTFGTAFVLTMFSRQHKRRALGCDER
jgi:hypothetical protein